MMSRIAFLAALASAVAAPSSAAQWDVDHGKSRLGFSVQWAGESFVAKFNSWKAKISFDPSDLVHAKAVVTINLGTEASDSTEKDDGVKGSEGFSVTQFPLARFETTGFTAKGGTAYVATGNLSLHGITRRITMPFALTFSGNTAHMTAKTVVMRTDFALGTGEFASADTIGHEVAIIVDLTATKAR